MALAVPGLIVPRRGLTLPPRFNDERMRQAIRPGDLGGLGRMGWTNPPRSIAGGGGGGGGTDPFFSSVSLLAFNNNPANGTTTFLDQSGNAFSLTGAGSIAFTNATAPTGMTTSVAFVAASSQRVAGPVNAAFDLTGDFTYELWLNTSQAGQFPSVMGIDSASGPGLYLDNGKIDYFDGSTLYLSTGSVNDGAWHHLAVCRSGTSLTHWKDGVANGTGTVASVTGFGSTAFTIGKEAANAYLNGNIGPLRVTKGVARYTAGFTPPTLPLPTS